MSKRIRRRLCKKFIDNLGVEVILKRFNHQVTLDIYGEPDDGNVTLASSRIIKIVVNTEKRQVEETVAGGQPENDGREQLYFYCSGSEEIRTGDKIVYPPNTSNEWLVYYIEPSFLFGENIMNEVKCKRDARF
jgi:hypothetical protein